MWEQESKDEKKDEKEEKKVQIENPLMKKGETFVFDPEKYKEAVVTPWYRNQDQPQVGIYHYILLHLLCFTGPFLYFIFSTGFAFYGVIRVMIQLLVNC